jgi:uncharacterized protein YegP (UPF0339 family)
MSHKFKIVAAKDNQFRIQFLYNSEAILWSENYRSKTSAKNCIASIKKNAPGATIVDLSAGQTGSGYRFEIVAGKSCGFFLRFRARNGEVMATPEYYTVMRSALGAIASVQKNSPAAETVDETIAAAAPAPKRPAAKKPAPKKPAKVAAE